MQELEYLAATKDKSATGVESMRDHDILVAGIVLHSDRLIIRLKSDHDDEASDSTDRSLPIRWGTSDF
jgi:hypothetical protein